MPATYAHYDFGQECLKMLPEKLRKACMDNVDIFNFGVHGPDIFFYYDALKKNRVNTFGSDMHKYQGREFFAHCKEVYLSYDADRDAMTAYICGFLSHFTFDSTAHGYINSYTKNGPISHNLLEAQYEAHLIRKTGVKASSVNRSVSLRPSEYTASIISRFFDFDQKTVLASLKGQQDIIHLFYSPLGIKKQVIRIMIKLLRLSGDFGELFLDDREMDECVETNRKVDELRSEAIRKYPEIVENFWNYVEGKEVLNSYYNYDFEGVNHV